jgi:hypothetical protein
VWILCIVKVYTQDDIKREMSVLYPYNFFPIQFTFLKMCAYNVNPVIL